jgi:ligand-binding SRPBCC domain-containing protein
MPVYEREVRVAAPLEEVWAFHSTSRGLVDVTPEWMNLTVEATRGPDGEPDPDVLENGAVVEASMRPFGVGPRQRWVSKIIARGENADSAMFRDIMTEGPFPDWSHTHRFRADGADTIVSDHVEYELPGGPLGKLVGPFGVVGMAPMFRFRHRKTRDLLE